MASNTPPEKLTRQQVGLEMLDRVPTSTYTITRLQRFNGFHQVLLSNPRKILGDVSKHDGVKGSVLMDGWQPVCSNRAIRALIAKPFLEGLLEGYNNSADTADISQMLMQTITTPDGKYTLTEQGIWEIISPWLRWDKDQSNSDGVLRLKFSDYPIAHYQCIPIYPAGTAVGT